MKLDVALQEIGSMLSLAAQTLERLLTLERGSNPSEKISILLAEVGEIAERLHEIGEAIPK